MIFGFPDFSNAAKVILKIGHIISIISIYFKITAIEKINRIIV